MFLKIIALSGELVDIMVDQVTACNIQDNFIAQTNNVSQHLPLQSKYKQLYFAAKRLLYSREEIN